VEIIQDLMAKAKTETGLSVFAAILDKVYQTGRKVTEEFKQTMEIVWFCCKDFKVTNELVSFVLF
jgi:hypothetical protein